VTLTLGQLATAQAAFNQVNVSTYLQGLDIGTLHTCLAGVESAYLQIAAADTTKAVQDISGVASACLTSEGGGTGGLVYPFDFPDPFVLRVGGTYFAYATNSVGGNIQIIESTDLEHWSALGNAWPNRPGWAAPGETWAPAVGVIGDTYVLYYSTVAGGTGGGAQCISVATSTQPQGPFVDNSTAPLVCQTALSGSIDPSPFISSTGTPYLIWKSNGSATQPAQIWSQQLDPAGTALTGTGPTQLLAADLGWEAGVIEAPDLVVNAGRTYLFYSGNDWNSDRYAVGVALCAGPLGPCTEPWTAPILTSDADVAGPGGESVFFDASGNAWIAFHAWVPGSIGYPHSRQLYIRPLDLSGPQPVVGPGS
jgi:beta-xylosidase